MLQVSANYSSIYGGTHTAETMLIVGEPNTNRVTITSNNILSLTTHESLYGDYYKIGQAVMGSFDATLVGISPSQIPSMSRVEVWCRLTNGSEYTNWLPKGIFYTRKPDYDKVSTFMNISGYDMLYKANVVPYETGTVISGWTSETTRTVAQRMSAFIGIALEDVTQLAEYDFPAPPYGYSAREVLEDIATACCGNWTLTYINTGSESAPVMSPRLRFVPINNTSTVLVLGRSIMSYDEGDPVPAVGYVVIGYGTDNNGATLSKSSGTSGVGRDMELSIDTITDGDVIQNIADDILATYQGINYQPYTARGCELDPAYELGDSVSCYGVTSPLGNIDTNFSVAMYANIQAQGIPVDEDFPYTSRTERKIERNFATTKASIAVNADSISAEVLRATSAEDSLNNNLRSTITQTAEDLTIELTQVAEDKVEEHAQEQRTYLRYSSAGVELGDENANTMAKLTPTRLAFMANGDEKAYIGEDNGVYKFFVVNGHIVNKLELGDHWDLVASGVENNNRLTIRWRG